MSKNNKNTSAALNPVTMFAGNVALLFPEFVLE
jgi:hypothetical protein